MPINMAEMVEKSPVPADVELVEFSNTQEAGSYTREEEKRYEMFRNILKSLLPHS